MAVNPKEDYNGSGGDVVDQQTEIARRGLNYGGRFGTDRPTERNDERFREVDIVNGGFKK
jgi:hypothetical protein